MISDIWCILDLGGGGGGMMNYQQQQHGGGGGGGHYISLLLCDWDGWSSAELSILLPSWETYLSLPTPHTHTHTPSQQHHCLIFQMERSLSHRPMSALRRSHPDLHPSIHGFSRGWSQTWWNERSWWGGRFSPLKPSAVEKLLWALLQGGSPGWESHLSSSSLTPSNMYDIINY